MYTEFKIQKNPLKFLHVTVNSATYSSYYSLTWHHHCYRQCKFINDINDGADGPIALLLQEGGDL